MYHACIVCLFFLFSLWVTLPRAAQLLIHVPPNGGKLTAMSNPSAKMYRGKIQ
jgi:hypothetical protein